MAEILLSLTIIGVVAAITLPSLTGNINERTWNTQRKALYARMSQAISLMPALNGYGTLTAEQTDEDGNITQSAVDTATETFITEGLSKVLKINNICDSEHLSDCGIPSKITPLNGGTNINTSDITTLHEFNELFESVYYKTLDTSAAAFETANGESIMVYYNPNCNGNSGESETHYVQPKMCANFIYDLNGKKGPNAVGKDIGFITALHPTDPVVIAPQLTPKSNMSGNQAFVNQKCQSLGSENRLPNKDEVASLFYNKLLVEIPTGHCWTGSIVSGGETGKAWILNFWNGMRYTVLRSETFGAMCVKR